MVPDDKDIIIANGVYYVARLANAEWPYIIRPYPDLPELKERNAPTENAAIQLYRHMTRVANKANPDLKRIARQYQGKYRGTPADVEKEIKEAQKHKNNKKRLNKVREERHKLDGLSGEVEAQPVASFAGFECIYANPYAQVWKCVRPSKDEKVPHRIGEFMVVMWDKPVREPNGNIKVFEDPFSAKIEAMTLYENSNVALHWKENDPVVYDTINCQIIFRPDLYGTKRPFIVNLPRLGTWVKRSTGVPTHRAKKRPVPADASADERAAIEFANKLDQMRQDESPKIYSDNPQTFKSIVTALEALNEVEARLGSKVKFVPWA